MNNLQLKNTGVIRHWKLIHDFTAKESFYYIDGCVYNDSRQKFLDGTRVKTSKLLNIDFKNMTAETENSIYELKDMDR